MQACDASTWRLFRPVSGMVFALLAACAQNRTDSFQSPGRANLPRAVEVAGDWDDVPAVVAGIIPRVELVANPPSIHDDHTYRCVIHSTQFGPGSLQFDRLDNGLIRIDARIGRFEHREEEFWVEQALAERFTQIKGEIAAPIRVSPRPPR
ncbi:MAG: hypothetical protein KJZ65_11460 [Phycisphaerales bacterium]|nr:hypothetical protein [Phycisphaerales bacterium]